MRVSKLGPAPYAPALQLTRARTMNALPYLPAGTPFSNAIRQPKPTSLSQPPLWRWILIIAHAAFLSACGSDSNERSPQVLEFTASATTIAAGDTATLSYRVEGNPPPEVSLIDEETRGALSTQGTSGSAEVSPETTTTFTLTARNKSGEASESLTITVVQPPEILSFGLEAPPEDGLLLEGAEYRVVWEVSGDYDEIQLDGEVVSPASGGKVFVADETTSHGLSVSWFDGARTVGGEALEVAVLRKPVIASFTASPEGEVAFGDDVQLAWELEGGEPDSIHITEEGGGAVPVDARSYVRERVTNTITHRLEVRNRAGSAEEDVTIEVDPASTPYGLLKVHNGRVVVMRPGPVSGLSGQEPEYVPVLTEGIKGEALVWMGGEFYSHFADVFDFVIFVGALGEEEASVYAADEWPWYDDQFIFSDEPGLGRFRPTGKKYLTGLFGSARDELRGVSFHPHIGDVRNGPSLREVIRHWGVPFVQTVARRSPCDPGNPDASENANGECRDSPEEGFGGFSSNAGQLGGFDAANLTLVREVECTEFPGDYWHVYRAGHFSPWGPGDNSIGYSQWELYAAGMLPANEVRGELVNFPTGRWYVDDGGNQIFDAETGEPLFLNVEPAGFECGFIFRSRDMIDDIIQVWGERAPESPAAAQAFVGAVVLIVDGTHLPDDAALDALAEDVSWLSNPAPDGDPMFNFFEATGGRGQLLLEQLGQHRLQTPGSVDALPVRVQKLMDRLGVELP